MKNASKKAFAVLLVVCVLTGLFYGCGKDNNAPTVTDPEGVTYLAVENDKTGETYAAVEGEDGKIYAVPTNPDGSLNTAGETFEVTNFEGTLPVNDTTAVSINDSQDNTYDFATGEVVTKENATTDVITITTAPSTSAPSTVPSSSDVQATENADPSQTVSPPQDDTTTTAIAEPSSSKAPPSMDTAKDEVELLAEKYKTLFSSGTYYVEFSTNDSDMQDPVTAAIKNGNIYMKTKLEGLDCAMIYKKSKDKVYVVLPKYRAYCIMSSDMIDDLDLSNFTDISDVTSVKVYEATVGDKECLCERYESKNGESATYYFYKGEQLVRIDQTDASGDVSIMNIIKISSDVSDDLFELPKGYMPINLSMLDLNSSDD